MTAEPGFPWSKSPATTRVEFANRIGGGIHPDDVFKQILGEINDHYAAGHINNRDAHRAANEAFGRLLFARKKMGRPIPHQQYREPQWDEFGGDFEARDRPIKIAPESMPEDAYDDDDRDPLYIGSDWDIPSKRHPQLNKALTSSRKHSWTGWGPETKHPKVAGWNWDKHLSAYIAEPGTSEFTCKCGSKFDVPSYHECGDCGSIFNAYPIGTGGDRHEASIEKVLCREIPGRGEDVIVASKRKAAPDFSNKFLTTWRDNEHPDAEQYGMYFNSPGEGHKHMQQMGVPRHLYKTHTTPGIPLEQHGEWNPESDPFDPREFGANLSKRKKGGYDDHDKALNDWEYQEETEFPSDHHPKVDTKSKGSHAKDWHRRDHGTQRFVQ